MCFCFQNLLQDICNIFFWLYNTSINKSWDPGYTFVLLDNATRMGPHNQGFPFTNVDIRWKSLPYHMLYKSSKCFNCKPFICKGNVYPCKTKKKNLFVLAFNIHCICKQSSFSKWHSLQDIVCKSIKTENMLHLWLHVKHSDYNDITFNIYIN